MSFRSTLKTIVDNLMVMFVVPIWLMKFLPFTRTKIIYSAFTNFEVQLRGLIDCERRGETNHKNDSVLRTLVGHEEGKSDRRGLNDSEIIGNAFALLLGGYESTYRPVTIGSHNSEASS